MTALAKKPELAQSAKVLAIKPEPIEKAFPSLFQQVTDEDTGELYLEPKIAYIEGRPKVYRFDGKVGRFNLDAKTDLGTSFTFQPFSWRLFKGSLFDRKESTVWVEFFFLDEKNCVSTIMFNNTSAINFKESLEKIVYSRKRVEDLTISLVSDKRDYEITLPDGKTQKGNYFAATFSFEDCDKELRKLGREVSKAYSVFGQVTIEGTTTNTTAVSDWFPKTILQKYGVGEATPVVETVECEVLPNEPVAKQANKAKKST